MSHWASNYVLANALFSAFEDEHEITCCFLQFQLMRLVPMKNIKLVVDLLVVGHEPQSESDNLVSIIPKSLQKIVLMLVRFLHVSESTLLSACVWLRILTYIGPAFKNNNKWRALSVLNAITYQLNL